MAFWEVVFVGWVVKSGGGGLSSGGIQFAKDIEMLPLVPQLTTRLSLLGLGCRCLYGGVMIGVVQCGVVIHGELEGLGGSALGQALQNPNWGVRPRRRGSSPWKLFWDISWIRCALLGERCMLQRGLPCCCSQQCIHRGSTSGRTWRWCHPTWGNQLSIFLQNLASSLCFPLLEIWWWGQRSWWCDLQWLRPIFSSFPLSFPFACCWAPAWGWVWAMGSWEGVWWSWAGGSRWGSYLWLSWRSCGRIRGGHWPSSGH